MKKCTLLFAILSFLVYQCCFSQSYIEGVDLPNTGVGPVFTVQGPSISVQGTLNTPYDSQDRFQINIPTGCAVTGVAYLITDTFNISVNGFTQFGTNNQITVPPLTGSFTGGPSGPFPVTGPVTLDCVMSANIAANDTWFMVFFNNCGGCTDPDIPNLGPDQTICLGDNVLLDVSAANLNDATSWEWYTDSCGQNPIGSGATLNVSPALSTTYFVRGEGGCVIPGACESVSLNVSVVDTSITYTTGQIWSNAINAQYRWLNCDSGYTFNGHTGSSYSPGVPGNFAVEVTNQDGCIDTSLCYPVFITGIDGNLIKEHVSFFPNPVKKQFNLRINGAGNYSLSISDMYGRIISESELNSFGELLTVFDLSYFKSGLYFLHLNSENYTFTFKLIKE